MGTSKRRNDLDLTAEDIKRTARNLQSLIESYTVADNDNLIKIRIELNEIHTLLKGIDAQNKALFKLYGVLYKMLAEPEKPHDKFEMFNEQDEQQGGEFHPNT